LATRATNNYGGARPSHLEQARAALYARLRARRTEIEQAALTRVYAVSDPTEAADLQYLDGLRAAVSAALDYGFGGIECGRARLALPAALLNQARLAARNNITLDTVLRRCFAVYTLFGDFFMQEADNDRLGCAALKGVLRAHAASFDRLLVAVTDEYNREAESRLDTVQQRDAERVARLLAGELLDTSEFDYDFAAHHVGVIGTGATAEDAIRQLASRLDRRLLMVRPTEEAVWAWMGGRLEIVWSDLQAIVSSSICMGVPLALGESTTGLTGWRLTHLQAKAARPIALRRGDTVLYSSVAILTSLVQDDLLATFLRDFLKPFEKDRDGGKTARKTLRAYFAAERNISSAAAALGVSRRTVANRLRAIEERLGRSLGGIGVEMELALRFDALEAYVET
jgi:hypothetical protein